ncbi:hypothetical protein [Sphingobacterium composti Ten et al. 2007 non Yoo et al. 2007]|uniref:hypothetical protein n=1 Tax=Sphingobacterium composti TaxID=363260 RepID=UPI00135BAC2C|nr:hypothetical protein [Sphingobacterium composti Ten et al. 2007 non Yoo et al. 2007]
MKNYIILCALFIIASLSSCYKDETSVDTRQISEISVELPFDENETIQYDNFLEFTIEPIVTQTNPNLNLTYEWYIENEIVSNERILKYTPNTLGLFESRLKVSNEDGSTYYRFKLKINSPYEEGLMILTENSSREGDFNFIRRLPNQQLSEMSTSSVHKNVIAFNNPDLSFGKMPTDIIQRGNMVYISNKEGKIYGLDYSTFIVERTIQDANYNSLKPMHLLVPNDAGRTGLVISEDGNLYEISTFENVILKAPNLLLDTVVENRSQVIIASYQTNYFLWNKKASQLLNFYNSYYLYNSGNYFVGKDLLTFAVTNNNIYVLTKDKQNPSNIHRSVLSSEFTFYGRYADATTTLLSATSTNIHKDHQPLVVDKYVKYLYADGRSVYQWFFTTDNLPTSPFVTINIPGVITAIEKDPEENELFVAVYDSTSQSNSGSVLVYDIQTGTLKASFLGISDKPVKLYYKKRVN